MKRSRKGTTRTGAIPECMAAMMTPNRAFELNLNRWMGKASAAYDEAVYSMSMSGIAPAYFDSAPLFSTSHPASKS